MKVAIEDRDDDGRGRGWAGRRRVLVSQAHPGECVTVRVDKKTRGTLEGRVARLLVADPARISHTCRQEFYCTGCAHLALPPSVEAEIKQEKLQRLAVALGAADRLLPLRVPTPPFGYRHQAKEVFARRPNGRVVLGSYVQSTREVADMKACPVLAPALAELMAHIVHEVGARRLPVADEPNGLRYAVARLAAGTGELLLTLVMGEGDADVHQDLCVYLLKHFSKLKGVALWENPSTSGALLAGKPRLRWGTSTLQETLLGFRCFSRVDAFFQVNPTAAAVLFALARDMAGEGDACIELFSGVGALTLPLAGRFRTLHAVESAGPAADLLRRNVSAHGARSVIIHQGDAAALFGQLAARVRPQTVVADPPRRGLGSTLVRALADSSAARLVLLACEPASLLRDLPPLQKKGFGVRVIAGVDQFPRTAHVEAVVLLQR